VSDAARFDEPVSRPVWRRFAVRFVDRALAYVGDGGFAAVVHPDGAVEALLPRREDGTLASLGWWALASLDAAPASRDPDGAGPHRTRLDALQAEAVLDWCDRDAVHPGPRRAMPLDCVACTACCQDAHVVLEAADVERLGAVLGSNGAPLARDAEGRLLLVFVDGRCPNLEVAGACRIYSERPDACREFPPGSEPCLAAREETLGLRDEVADEEALASEECN